MLLHTKYLGSRPCGFCQEEFYFPFITLYKIDELNPSGRAPFDHKSIIWTNFVNH